MKGDEINQFLDHNQNEIFNHLFLVAKWIGNVIHFAIPEIDSDRVLCRIVYVAAIARGIEVEPYSEVFYA